MLYFNSTNGYGIYLVLSFKQKQKKDLVIKKIEIFMSMKMLMEMDLLKHLLKLP